MPQFYTSDRRYVVNLDQPDGNSVVYRVGQDGKGGETYEPVWDRFSDAVLWQTNVPPGGLPPDTLDRSDPPPAQAGISRVIRVTGEQDGALVPRMYSYWSNAFVLARVVYVFCGHADGRPRFFAVNLDDGVVTRVPINIAYTGTTEGWYWDSGGRLYLIDGPRLRWVDPFSGDDRVAFDISDSHPGCVLWQAHSSDDGQVHSATVMKRIEGEGAWPKIGTIVSRLGDQMYFAAKGVLDESAIDATGEWLIIKEDDLNRVIRLPIGEERVITSAHGAVGHSDCGPGFVIGEDDQLVACVRWDFPAFTERTFFSTWAMGHVCVRAGRYLISGPKDLALGSVEGGMPVHLVDHGMVGTDYDHQVQGNLDPTGRVACWMSNVAGRLDVYVMELPT